MTIVPPITWTPETRRQLVLQGAYWRQRLDLRLQHVPGIPWSPGLRVTPELRWCYESLVPIASFCHSMGRLAAEILPDRSWVPRILRTRVAHMERRVDANGPRSLPDLWALMPATFAGRVSFAPTEMGTLLCALADLARFGTDTARYPDQLRQLRHELNRLSLRTQGLRLLDLACGVGHGTLEAAAVADGAGVPLDHVLGITLEPLEAWMAAKRCLPHSLQRQSALRSLPHHLPVLFACGDIRRCPCDGPFNIILCNGLIGGPSLDTDAGGTAVLGEAKRLLSPAGCMLAANRFHAGRRSAVERFTRQAVAAGWDVEGSWQALVLHNSSPPDLTISG